MEQPQHPARRPTVLLAEDELLVAMDIEASLRELGCETGQGFYFARPRPSEAIAELLGSREPVAPRVNM